MGPNDEGVLNESKPTFGLKGRWINDKGFKMFHENVCYYGGETRTHGSPLGLFIKLAFETKESRGEEKFNKIKDLYVY